MKRKNNLDFYLMIVISAALFGMLTGMNGFLKTHKVALDKDGRPYPQQIGARHE